MEWYGPRQVQARAAHGGVVGRRDCALLPRARRARDRLHAHGETVPGQDQAGLEAKGKYFVQNMKIRGWYI